jgi:hypothetical protein
MRGSRMPWNGFCGRHGYRCVEPARDLEVREGEVLGLIGRLAFAAAATGARNFAGGRSASVGTLRSKRSIWEMENVANGGRAMVLVSHSVVAVNAFWSRCVILEFGWGV